MTGEQESPPPAQGGWRPPEYAQPRPGAEGSRAPADPTQEIRGEDWFSPAGMAPAERARAAATQPVPTLASAPPPTGPPYPLPPVAGYPAAQPPPFHQPAGPAGRTPRSRSGALLAGAAGIALVSGMLGGGAVLVTDRALTGPQVAGPTAGPIPPPGPGSTARPAGSIANIAARALPSVVTLKVKGADGAGTGSGFVIDRAGHILTNNHVVTSVAGGGSITVLMSDSTPVTATIVGRDASYDLAVLKVDRSDLPPLEFGRSADVVVGDGVIAVGAPLGLEATVTTGIVSALDRPVTPGGGDEQSFINAIQTDAAINPGNSGGPLLDMNGKVIGVNSAIARIPGSTSGTGGNIGVGFAIPSDQAFRTAQQLITTGKAVHPMIGVRIDRTFDGDGAKVADSQGVTPGSPAAAAGIQNGDVIVEFEGKRVTDPNQLVVAIRARSVGDVVSLKVRRGSQTLDMKMTLQAATG